MPLSQEILAAQAGVDPWKLLQQFNSGDPAEISQLAADFARAGGNTALSGKLAAKGRDLAANGYAVDGSPVPTSHVAQVKAQAGNSRNLISIAKTLDAIADDLFQRTRTSKFAVGDLNKKIDGWNQEYTTNERVIHGGSGPSVRDAKAENVQILRAAVTATRSVGNQVHKSVGQYEQRLAYHQRALARLGYTPPPEANSGSGPGSRPQIGVPGPNSSPQRNRAWWNSLSAAQRHDVIRQSPRSVGNLAGIPAAARDAANRLALKQDVFSVNTDVRRNALATRAALSQVRRDPHTNQQVPYQLWAYEPGNFGGDGRIAIAVGDLDKARNVAVSVPGINTPGAEISWATEGAANLYESTRYNDPSTSTAVLAWIGYDTPTGFVDIVSDTPRESVANDGARRLVADLDGIRVSRGSDQPLNTTVVGHSYGSSTVGLAATYHGLRADNIVLVGSPGAGYGVEHASQLGGAKVYAATAPTDLINLTDLVHRAHGGDPTNEQFSAIRFAANTDKTPGRDAHTSYFDPYSESLHNLGKVVSGDGDSVTIAPHSTDNRNVSPGHHRPGSGPHKDTEDAERDGAYPDNDPEAGRRTKHYGGLSGRSSGGGSWFGGGPGGGTR